MFRRPSILDQKNYFEEDLELFYFLQAILVLPKKRETEQIKIQEDSLDKK
jgi:hypothetical protein